MYDDQTLPEFMSQPFTTREAAVQGANSRRLHELARQGQVRRLLQGVYVNHTTADSYELRLAALRLVTTKGSVIVDETAAWLHGANMALEPNAHLDVPPLHVFDHRRGYRMRRGEVRTGERRFDACDLVDAGDLLVTTPLRTACDLARLRVPKRALAAVDQLLRLGSFSAPRLSAEIQRFRGMRGVVRARYLALIADPGAQSPPESAMRWEWLQAGLPRPTTQCPMVLADGSIKYADLGLEELRFAAEYDGQEFHTATMDTEHDGQRRDQARQDAGWDFCVLRRADVYGPGCRAGQLLRAAYEDARTSFGVRRRLWSIAS